MARRAVCQTQVKCINFRPDQNSITRVRTSTGIPRISGKMRKVFPVWEKSGNFKILRGVNSLCFGVMEEVREK